MPGIEDYFVSKGLISSKKNVTSVSHDPYQPQVLLQRQQEYQQNLQEEERNDHLEEEIMNQFETESHDSNGDDDVLSDEGEREERAERIGLILKEERRIDKIFRSVEDPKNLTLDELGKVLREGVLAESSQKSYESWLNSMLSRGFPNTPRGLVSFLVSREGSVLKISNKTMEYIITSFKHFYFLEQRKVLTDVETKLVQMALQMRRRQFPDFNRCTGAMNKARTRELLEFAKEEYEKKSFSKERYEMIRDAATMLYAGALRVSQLEHLDAASECFKEFRDEDGKLIDLTITVISKGHEKRKATQFETGIGEYETKQVHPEFQEAVLEIRDRRMKQDTHLFYDFKHHRKAYSDFISDTALHYGWPAECRFSGTHVSRHGAAQDAYEEGGLDLVMLRTGHLALKSAQYYSLSDAQRSDRINFRIEC